MRQGAAQSTGFIAAISGYNAFTHERFLVYRLSIDSGEAYEVTEMMVSFQKQVYRKRRFEALLA